MSTINSTTLTNLSPSAIDMSYELYLVNGGTAGFNLTLPSNTAAYTSQIVSFTRIDTTIANAVTITATGGAIFTTLPTGSNTVYSLLPGSTVRFQCDGTNWNIMSGNTVAQGMGNIAIVDSVYGNDNNGAVSGRPFKTVGKAITAINTAGSGQVLVYPGTYSETLTVPAGVIIRGTDRSACIISQTVALATNLITVNDNVTMEDLTLSITSTADVQIATLVFGSGTATGNCLLQNLTISATGSVNTNAASTYAIYCNTNNANPPAVNGTQIVKNCGISATNAGKGITVGVQLDTNKNTLNIRSSSITVTNSNAGAGIGTVIGAQTNNANMSLGLYDCRVSASLTGGGTSSNALYPADISQTLGVISLAGATLLLDNKAAGFGFSTATTPSTMQFGSTAIPNGKINFFYLGTSTVSTNTIGIPIPVNCICRGITVYARTAGSAGRTDAFSVTNSNAAASNPNAVAVTLSGPAQAISSFTASQAFNAGDILSLSVNDNNVGGTGPTDVQVLLSFY